MKNEEWNAKLDKPTIIEEGVINLFDKTIEHGKAEILSIKIYSTAIKELSELEGKKPIWEWLKENE